MDDLRRRGPAEDDFSNLFDDFGGLEFGDKVVFSAHEANWSNQMIIDDSLLAMTSLAERSSCMALTPSLLARMTSAGALGTGLPSGTPETTTRTGMLM